MNLSAAIMLVQDGIRPVRVLYDPDNAQKSYNPTQLFKTLDTDLKKDDLVIVPTTTRHGFTIAKVTEIDFPVDFNSAYQWGWIGGRFDKTSYDEVLQIETKAVHRIGKIEENKMKNELKDAMGLGEVDFKDLFVTKQPALATPRAAKTAAIGEEKLD